jgi:hypothetical protein
MTVWKNGDDVRLLIEDEALREQINKELEAQADAESSAEGFDYEKGYEAIRRRAAARAFDHISWRKFAQGRVDQPAAQPPGIEAIPLRDSHPVAPSNDSWKARAANVEIRADLSGLYKIARGQFMRIREGYFDSPFITPNARWAIASNYDEGFRLVRVNLANNREFPVALPEFRSWTAQAYVPGINRVLLRGAIFAEHDEEGEGSPGSVNYAFLDPDTGAVEPVRGEVRPLGQLTVRPLQATATPDVFWAAIPDEGKKETIVGLYDLRTLTFKPVQKIPRISFSSMDMWVDEKENQIYLVYLGHLLSLPLKPV